MAESVVFTGLIVTVLLKTSPDLLVLEMVTYGPLIMLGSGELLHVISTVLVLAMMLEASLAVQVTISSVPWYTLPSLS